MLSVRRLAPALACAWLVVMKVTVAAPKDEARLRLQVRRAYPRIQVFGHFGFGQGEFRKPTALALGPGGRIAVTDVDSYSVTVLDSEGLPLMTVNAQGGQPITVNPSPASGGPPAPRGGKKDPKDLPPGALNGPLGVAFDREGNLFVSEDGSNIVRRFDPKGKLTGQLGGTGAGPGRFRSPRGLCFDGQGNLYIADYDNFRVQVMDKDFRFSREVRWQAGGRRLGAPHDVDVDSAGRMWVTYPNVHKVVRFDAQGAPETVVGGFGTGTDQFRSPRYVACDPMGNAFVTDYDNHRIQKYGDDGKYEFSYGLLGNNRGQFKHPQGIDVDEQGNLYVVDTDSFRFQVLRIDSMLADLNRAEILFRARKDKESLEVYGRVLTQNPYHAVARSRTLEICSRLADQARQASKLDEAKGYVGQILKIEPSNVPAHKFLRWILWRENKGWIYHVTLLAGIFLTFIFLVSAMVKMLTSY